MTDIRGKLVEGLSSQHGDEGNDGEFILHKSEGRVDNSDPDLLDSLDLMSAKKTSSIASTQTTATLDTPELRETASLGNFPVAVIPGEESSEALQETLQSFVAAVHKKYNNDDDEGIPEAVGDVVFVPKTGPVKLTASGNIMLPRQVSMSGCEINVAGDPVLIKRMCQRVRELDLMENNIHCWDEVFCILECIPQLTFLNLTKNHLTSDLPDLTGRSLPSLTHLVLNNTMITWDVLLRLLELFPSVEELHLSLNGFESVDIPATETSKDTTSCPVNTSQRSYSSLRKIFFIGNKVLDWREINKLGMFFPNLEFLLLSETDLTSIQGSDDVADCFPSLQTLGLNRTLLCSWEEIEKLRLFPSLTDVRLNAIPFLEAFPEKVRRQHTVALLPNITSLNGSPVREEEREDAERAYIRMYMDKDEKTKRYFELEKQHGKLDPLAKVQLEPKSQVKIIVRVEGPDEELIKEEELNIYVHQTIQELKKMLSNMVGHPVSKFQLFYIDVEIDGGAREADLSRLESPVLQHERWG